MCVCKWDLKGFLANPGDSIRFELVEGKSRAKLLISPVDNTSRCLSSCQSESVSLSVSVAANVCRCSPPCSRLRKSLAVGGLSLSAACLPVTLGANCADLRHQLASPFRAAPLIPSSSARCRAPDAQRHSGSLFVRQALKLSVFMHTAGGCRLDAKDNSLQKHWTWNVCVAELAMVPARTGCSLPGDSPPSTKAARRSAAVTGSLVPYCIYWPMHVSALSCCTYASIRERA